MVLNNMTWDDVTDILFDSTPEQISAIRCPNCNGDLSMEYTHTTRSYEIRCNGCYTLIRAHGAEKTPNFALLRGGVE